jgi:formate dehydrogenase major subunit/formate dehydrogenase alpha subunit
MNKIPTVCPYCGCGCGLYLHIDNGTVTGVSPSRSHPVNKGSLCVKGWNCHEFIQHPRRLKYPSIRKNGSLKRTSWDEAYDHIAKKLARIKKSFGPDSIGILSSAKCTNEENYLMMKFARAVIGTNNIDHCARLCHSSTVGGLASAFGSGAMTNSISEISNAKVIFAIGSNTTEQHPMVAMHMLDAVNKGALLIVADPRRNMIADLAHIHLKHRSGTDVALLNSIMHVIIKEGLVDIAFVKRRTENFDAFEKVIKQYPPEAGEAITGVRAKDIRKVAGIYAHENRSMLFFAMGITQHITGVDNVCACADLTMLTAHVGHAIAGLNPLRGQNNVQGSCDMGALPEVFSGYQKVSDNRARKKFTAAWGTDLPGKPGLTLVEMLKASLQNKIKAMYIMGENPVISDPDAKHTIRALKKLRFLVVQDIFMTETAGFADVVLPAVSFAEKEGTFTNTERRVQKIRKAVEPPGEALSDWEIISELSKRMGYHMDYNAPHEIMEEIAFLTPSYRGILHHRLDRGFGLQWPCNDVNHPGTPFLHRKKFARGLGSFMPVHYIPPDEQPDKEYDFILTTGRTYFQYHTGTMTRKTATLEREQPECIVEINVEDAARLGIKDRDKIRVSTKRGSIKAIAGVTDKIISGTVFIPFHFYEASANMLTNPALDPKAKIPEYKVCAAKVEKAK